MSLSKQLQDFDLHFVQETMREWSNLAQNYENEAQKIYTKLRSYLTFHQFRLNDQQKYEIRDMLSQELDELEKVNVIEDLDNYLDGFCFKLDKSILPKRQPTEVKIQIAPEPKPASIQPTIAASSQSANYSNNVNHSFNKSCEPTYPPVDIFTNNAPHTPAFDNAVDFDIFEMMFNS